MSKPLLSFIIVFVFILNSFLILSSPYAGGLKMMDDHVSEGFTDAGEVFLEVLGDQNKDGRDEFFLSSPTNGTNGVDSGILQYFWGDSTIHDSLEIYNTDLIFLGGEGYLLGTDALFWNIDGDGYDDLVIGCPGAGG
ncbi:MAG: hypothetical protein KAH57_08615, partial [Thermoplasmata archaeon]|nr:hypothetical protein [Thermoplasmata archaeon]